VDLAVVEGAGGDQVVEVAGGLPQLAVALTRRSGGDPGQLLGQGRPGVAVTRAVGGGRELVRTRWPLELPWLQPLEQHRGNRAGWGVEIAAGDPVVGVAGGVAAGRGDHIATPAPPVHLLQAPRVDVAQAGRGQIEMPATPASPNQRPRTCQAIGGGQLTDGSLAGGTVDVQDVEQVAGGQADVGLGPLGPPGQDPGSVGGGVLDAVGHEAAQGVLGGLAAAWIPTRAARPHGRARQLVVAGEGLEVAVVGQGVVQGQDRDAAGGIAKRGVPHLRTPPAHGVGSSAGGRWRCRKLAALLRPQPAASARVRAVQGLPSGRGWA
jgi:hypothetical protein